MYDSLLDSMLAASLPPAYPPPARLAGGMRQVAVQAVVHPPVARAKAGHRKLFPGKGFDKEPASQPFGGFAEKILRNTALIRA